MRTDRNERFKRLEASALKLPEDEVIDESGLVFDALKSHNPYLQNYFGRDLIFAKLEEKDREYVMNRFVLSVSVYRIMKSLGKRRMRGGKSYEEEVDKLAQKTYFLLMAKPYLLLQLERNKDTNFILGAITQKATIMKEERQHEQTQRDQIDKIEDIPQTKEEKVDDGW